MDKPSPSLVPTKHPAVELRHGHCLDILKSLPSGSVHCCVTSPPYWGLRDYGTDPLTWGGIAGCPHQWQTVTKPTGNGKRSTVMLGTTVNRRSATRTPHEGASCPICGAWRGSLGLEPTPELYVNHLVAIFREVMRVIRDDGTLWLILGDCFAGSWGDYHPNSPPGKQGQRARQAARWQRRAYRDPDFLPPTATVPNLKAKNLVGIPWRVAFALQADGWYLRSDIIWHKPNPTPESVRDRPTRAHEYIFLLSKNRRYFYNQTAIAEPLADASLVRLSQPSFDRQAGGDKDYSHALAAGHRHRSSRRILVNLKGRALPPNDFRPSIASDRHGLNAYRRNRRSVWTVPTQPFRGPHFATFPKDLIRLCLRAGCPVGGTVLDPFMGAGTTGLVAREENRRFVGIELNREYLALAQERIASSQAPTTT